MTTIISQPVPLLEKSYICPARQVPDFIVFEVIYVSPLPCPFCSPAQSDIVLANALWYARWDAFPATRGHLLIIPFHHCASIFDTTPEEQTTLPEILFAGREFLDTRFSPDGYNIVINTGAAADQRVMHCHVHLIPRYTNGKQDLPGGIRGFVMDQPERVL